MESFTEVDRVRRRHKPGVGVDAVHVSSLHVWIDVVIAATSDSRPHPRWIIGKRHRQRVDDRRGATTAGRPAGRGTRGGCEELQW